MHTCRGRDEEGAAVLHQAIAVAERAGARAEGVAALRELGYVSVQAGDRPAGERPGPRGGGRRWLEDALVRCTRVPDRYEWAHGYVLEALVDEAVRAGDPGAQAAAQRLHALAARTGMRELVVRAQVHLHRLGAPGALESVLLLAREIDNPRLGALLAAHTPAHTPAAQAPPTPREGGSP